MREIKFEFIFESGAKGIYSLDDITNEDGAINFAPIKYKRQYTGLKDKNGVDIYEGDIIADGYGNNGEVTYNQDCCQFLVNMGEGIDLQELGSWGEVIGNIYEHPHLLGT